MHFDEKNSVKQAFEMLEKCDEKIDICVNNAGALKNDRVIF